MKNNAVTNKIKALKNVKPNPDWLKSQRRNILLEISSDNKVKQTNKLSGFSMFKLFKTAPKLALKPVVATVLLLTLFFGGGWLTVSSAQNSAPGDFLYPLKLAIEDIKLTLSSEENKSKLQAQFINHRVKELTKVLEDSSDKKDENTNKAIENLENQIASTKSETNKTQKNNSEETSEIAEAVKQQTINSEKELREAKQVLIEEYKKTDSEELAKVIKTIDKVLAALLNEEAEANDEEGVSTTGVEQTQEELEQAEEDIITYPNQLVPQKNASESSDKASESYHQGE